MVSVVVRETDASGSIVVKKGSAEVSIQRRAPDQESSLGGRIGNWERDRCGIDRDIPQIFRATRFQDLGFRGQRCHCVDLATARLAMPDLFGVSKRQKEMHARIAGVESLGLQLVRRGLLKDLARHRLNKRHGTSNECRWSCIVYFFLSTSRCVVGSSSIIKFRFDAPSKLAIPSTQTNTKPIALYMIALIVVSSLEK